jgi:hypothetical protein
MASTAELMGLGMPGQLAAKVTDGVAETIVNGTAAGIRTIQSTDDVNNTTPSAAELTAAFGAPATVGSGFIGVVKDNDEDTNCFVVVSNGTSYFYLKFTKAT